MTVVRPPARPCFGLAGFGWVFGLNSTRGHVCVISRLSGVFAPFGALEIRCAHLNAGTWRSVGHFVSPNWTMVQFVPDLHPIYFYRSIS
jgi:hypothetical protein